MPGVQITGTRVRLEHALDAMKTEAVEVVREACQVAEAEMVRLAPKRTGATAASIKPTVRRTQTGAVGTVGPHTDYATFVDEGTGTYVEHHAPIRSTRPGGRLKFTAGGQVLIRRSVKGQRPKPFVQEASVLVERRVETILKSGAERANRLITR